MQTPFETVHLSTFVPLVSKVTAEVLVLIGVKVPEPTKTDHAPVSPTERSLAARLYVSLMHEFPSGPASTNAGLSLVIITSSVEVQPLYSTCHVKIFSPGTKSETGLAGLVESSMITVA